MAERSHVAGARAGQLQGRVHIEDVAPVVDCGRYPAKGIVGDDIHVSATILREGHDLIAAQVRWRGPDHSDWQHAALQHHGNDHWAGSFPVDRVGDWRFQVCAWTDHYATWLDALRKKFADGQDLELVFQDGAALLRRREGPPPARERWLRGAERLQDQSAAPAERLAEASAPELLELLARHPEPLDLSQSADFPLWIDREAARFSAWYELFPRSEGAVVDADGRAVRSGTLAQAAKRLPDIAAMGFDVVYLPPIHPIGRTFRKGRNNSLQAEPHDPGVPWAIGGPEGGHKAVHPDLGTLEDFDDFVAEARAHNLEVALDYAIQCSPDHPWVHEHPEWFRHRADGSIAYAENPPKRYQDIYPIDFDTPDQEGLWHALKDVVDFWISHGVRIFRVDNPHTKALPFWRWLITGVKATHPDVLFLSEAFTRPAMMRALAKLGFSQSYTYFAWRNTKHELTEYVSELAHGPMADYFRPHFWPNTPDILTDYLVHGDRAAFKIRLLLAALLSPSYGIYSGYELCEATPLRPGSEEYLDSEKYTYRPRDWSRPDSLAPWIAQLNELRRRHPSLQHLRGVWFHHVDNDQLLCFSKTAPGRRDPILVVASLDPHQPQEGTTWLDLWHLGLEHAGPFEAHDLLTGDTYVWHGPQNYVRLDPAHEPAHVLRIRAL